MTQESKKDIAFFLFEQMHGRRNIGSSRIRGRWLVKYWDEAEVLKMGKSYKAVIFQKAYWVEYARMFKGIKIFDACDADFMDWHYRTKEMIEECDAVVTSTPLLAKAFRNFTSKEKPVICIPDRIDLEEHKEKKEHFGRAKQAVWFGYSTNFYLLQGIESHLYKLGLDLIIISDGNNFEFSERYKNLVKVTNIKWKVDTVHSNILKGDIVLNPFSAKGKWKYKSNNKSLMAKALGMPVATTPQELERFMEEKERKKAAIEGLEEIKNLWDVRISVKEYQQLINNLKEKDDPSMSLPK